MDWTGFIILIMWGCFCGVVTGVAVGIVNIIYKFMGYPFKSDFGIGFYMGFLPNALYILIVEMVNKTLATDTGTVGIILMLSAVIIYIVLKEYRISKSKKSTNSPTKKQSTSVQLQSYQSDSPTSKAIYTVPSYEWRPSKDLKIFISYRRSDTVGTVGRVYDRLIEKFGTEQIFKDVDSIPLGKDFREVLIQAIEQCDVVIAVIGKEWVNTVDSNQRRRLDDPRDFVRIEIETALQRDIPVIPVLVHGASMPQEKELPSTLKKLAYLNAATVRYDPDFHADIDRLIRALES